MLDRDRFGVIEKAAKTNAPTLGPAHFFDMLERGSS